MIPIIFQIYWRYLLEQNRHIVISRKSHFIIVIIIKNSKNILEYLKILSLLVFENKCFIVFCKSISIFLKINAINKFTIIFRSV